MAAAVLAARDLGAVTSRAQQKVDAATDPPTRAAAQQELAAAQRASGLVKIARGCSAQVTAQERSAIEAAPKPAVVQEAAGEVITDSAIAEVRSVAPAAAEFIRLSEGERRAQLAQPRAAAAKRGNSSAGSAAARQGPRNGATHAARAGRSVTDAAKSFSADVSSLAGKEGGREQRFEKGGSAAPISRLVMLAEQQGVRGTDRGASGRENSHQAAVRALAGPGRAFQQLTGGGFALIKPKGRFRHPRVGGGGVLPRRGCRPDILIPSYPMDYSLHLGELVRKFIPSRPEDDERWARSVVAKPPVMAEDPRERIWRYFTEDDHGLDPERNAAVDRALALTPDPPTAKKEIFIDELLSERFGMQAWMMPPVRQELMRAMGEGDFGAKGPLDVHQFFDLARDTYRQRREAQDPLAEGGPLPGVAPAAAGEVAPPESVLPPLEERDGDIIEKASTGESTVAKRKADGSIEASDTLALERILTHAGESPVYLPGKGVKSARAQMEREIQSLKKLAPLSLAAASAVAFGELPSQARRVKEAEDRRATKRQEAAKRYEEEISRVQGYKESLAREEAATHGEIEARMQRGEITGAEADGEFHRHMDAFLEENAGVEFRVDSALTQALEDFHDGLLSAQQINRLYEQAGAMSSGVAHYMQAREQLELGHVVKERMSYFAPPRPRAAEAGDADALGGQGEYPAAYNPQTGEWLRTETQEMADGLTSVFDGKEKSDRTMLFMDAGKIAQISPERSQKLEPLLEDFPTYPGPGPAADTKAHTMMLARVMEGMNAMLRHAENAEMEANAPRLTVPFYAFIEKGLEGAPIEEQQMAFAYGAMLMVDYLSLGTLGLATGPLMAIEPGLGAAVTRSGGTAVRTMRTLGEAERAVVRGGWKPRPGGVRLKKVGNYFIKEVNPDAPAFARWWGKGSIEAQAKALDKLGDMAPSYVFRNGRLAMHDAGVYTPGNFWNTWWRGTMRLKTPFNDIRPRNIGADGVIFDPAKHPIQQATEAAAIGTGGLYLYTKGKQ